MHLHRYLDPRNLPDHCYSYPAGASLHPSTREGDPCPRQPFAFTLTPDWRWKDSQTELNAGLNLLYEPGNWGDVLKALWAREVVAALDGDLRLLDPFSGALEYPCTGPTRERLSGSALSSFRSAQRAYLRRHRLASTGRLIQDACRQLGRACRVTIAEEDLARRESWGEEAHYDPRPPVELLGQEWRRHDLVLWDPYDFFDKWSHDLPHILQASQRIPVLVYLYNKSPRGVPQMRNYERLCERLDRDGAVVSGRVPSDSLLPRAYHEVMLLGPERLLGLLGPRLRKITERLHDHISRPGCFEETGFRA